MRHGLVDERLTDQLGAWLLGGEAWHLVSRGGVCVEGVSGGQKDQMEIEIMC